MIYGDRVRLRLVEKEDLLTFVRWFNDPEVRQGLTMNMPLSLGFEEKWYETNLARPINEQVLVIEIKDGDGWKMIGSTGFHDIDWVSRNTEVGIAIGEKDEWNKGYGTEVMQLMLDHGFGTLNLHRIYLRVFANNTRAIRAYQKVGYIEEGRQRQALYQDGKYIDVIFMSVIRHEWVP